MGALEKDCTTDGVKIRRLGKMAQRGVWNGPELRGERRGTPIAFREAEV